MKLCRGFYLSTNVVQMAQQLLGMVLCSEFNGDLCCALITETEAYEGATDMASHAYGGRRTSRTEVMFGPGGFAYIYLCYGIHSLFNVVTNQAGIPHAVLIRSVKPLEGHLIMQQRMKKPVPEFSMINGPGKVSLAMGFHYSMSGTDLTGNIIWIEDRAIDKSAFGNSSTPRIGVGYAGADALLPYRFVLCESKKIASQIPMGRDSERQSIQKWNSP